MMEHTSHRSTPFSYPLQVGIEKSQEDISSLLVELLYLSDVFVESLWAPPLQHSQRHHLAQPARMNSSCLSSLLVNPLLHYFFLFSSFSCSSSSLLFLMMMREEQRGEGVYLLIEFHFLYEGSRSCGPSTKKLILAQSFIFLSNPPR